MDISFLKSPGKIPKETVVKIIFISIAIIIIASVVAPYNKGGEGFSTQSVTVGSAPTMGNMVRLVSPKPMAPEMARDMLAYDSSGGIAGEMMYPVVPPITSGVAGSPDFPVERKIIRNGSLSLLVDHVSKTSKDIADLASRMGGFVENQNLYEYTAGSLQGSLSVRVPEDKFSDTLSQIKLLAVRVQNEQINSNDVSAEYVDVEARLKNAKVTETQYQAVLKQAGKISDILEATRALSQARSEVEQLQGQLNYLSRQTGMSTITVSLTPVANAKEVTNEWKPVLVVKESFKNLILSLTGLLSGLIVFVIQILPVLILQLAFLVIFLGILWKVGKKIFARLGGTLPTKKE